EVIPAAARALVRMTGNWRMVFVMVAAALSGGYSHTRRADATGCGPSIRRCHRDPHPQALTRIVGKARHVHVAAVTVFDVITHDLLLRRVVHRLADRLLGGVAAVVGSRHAVADRTTGDGTGHCRGLAAVALAHRASEYATHDRTQHSAARVIVVLLRHRLRITLLLRGLRGGLPPSHSARWRPAHIVEVAAHTPAHSPLLQMPPATRQ